MVWHVTQTLCPNLIKEESVNIHSLLTVAIYLFLTGMCYFLTDLDMELVDACQVAFISQASTFDNVVWAHCGRDSRQ